MLYSPRLIIGLGWTDGEAAERFWSAICHVIKSLRGAKSVTRRQTLTHLSLYVVKLRQLSLSYNFSIMLDRALANEKEYLEKVDKYCDNEGITRAELESQAEKMQNFFKNPLVEKVEVEDEICELIIALESIEKLSATHHHMKTKSQLRHDELAVRLTIGLCSGGRIDHSLDNSTDDLRKKLDQKLSSAGYDLSDFKNEDGSPTEMFERQMNSRLRLVRDLRRRKITIWNKSLHCQGQLEQLFNSQHLGLSRFFL